MVWVPVRAPASAQQMNPLSSVGWSLELSSHLCAEYNIDNGNYKPTPRRAKKESAFNRPANRSGYKAVRNRKSKPKPSAFYTSSRVVIVVSRRRGQTPAPLPSTKVTFSAREKERERVKVEVYIRLAKGSWRRVGILRTGVGLKWKGCFASITICTAVS